jgi:hypothetical protein
MLSVQAPLELEQLRSTSSRNVDYFTPDDLFCTFLQERHKNLSDPVNPVKNRF